MSNRHVLGTVILALAAGVAGCASKTNPGQDRRDASATGGTTGVGGSGTSVTGSGGASGPEVTPEAGRDGSVLPTGGVTGSGGVLVQDAPAPFEVWRDSSIVGGGGATGSGGVSTADVNSKAEVAGGTGDIIGSGGQGGSTGGSTSRTDGSPGGAVGSGGTSVADGSTGECPGSYDACGCRCCTDLPRDTMCYYPSAGETLEPIRAHDDQVRSTTDCSIAGCTTGIRYVCCFPAAPEPPSSATYTASGWMGDLDHLGITKVGKECVQVGFASGGGYRTGYHVDAPTGWAFLSAEFGPCVDGGALESVKGALGTLAMRKDGSTCVADLHITLYTFGDGGEIRTIRMDADGVPIAGAMGPGFCP